jgi:hypothetical protein
MNESIKELVKQSWKEGLDGPEFDLELYTRLMIQEFETVAKNPRWYFPDQQDGWRDPINCVCKEMKKHFGLKE